MLRLALGLVACGLACSSAEPGTAAPTTPQARTDRPPATDGGPASPTPLAGDGGSAETTSPASATATTEDPGELWTEIGLPGPARRTMVLKILLGPGVVLGCFQTTGERPCRPAEPITVSSTDLAEIERLWSAAVAQRPCRLTELRDGRPFVVRWQGRELAGDLPGDGSPIENLYGTECSAPHRLAEWLRRRFEGSIRAHGPRPGLPD